MLREPGAFRRAPARPSASGAGSDENAPLGASGVAASSSTPAPTESGAASRPALRAIQPAASGMKRKTDWPAPTPSKPPVWTNTKNGSWVRASKAPARLGTVATSLPAPTRPARKPALRLGSTTVGTNSAEGLCFKIQDENQDLQNVSSTLQQHDSHSPARIEDRSDEGFIRNSEDILKLQLELEILKKVLVEEITGHAETANLLVLEACRQKEAMERELNHQRRVTKALEQVMVINELDEPKKNNFESPVLLKKGDIEIPRLNSDLDIYCRKEYMPSEEARMQTLKCFGREDSPLSAKVKRLQASLEKALNLNTRYQQDLASQSSAKQRMDEVCRQAEEETAKVIESLTEELSSLQHQSKQSLHELQLEKNQLNDRLLEAMKKIESLSESKAYAEEENGKTLHAISKENTKLKDLVASLKSSIISLKKDLDVKNKAHLELENKVTDLRSLHDEKDIRFESLQNYLSKLLDEKRYCNAEVLILKQKLEMAWLIAEERKVYAEKQNKVVRLLERSTEDLETTICELEKKVNIIEQEAEQQKLLREELEVELKNVRQQMLAMPSSGKARSSLEDSAHSTRHPRDINYELLGPQESGRILRNEVSEKEAEVMACFANASELLEQSSKQPGLYGSCAEEQSNGRSWSECESEQVRPPSVEPVVEVVEESELPPVAPVQDRMPVDYTRAPVDELKRLRNRNHYAEQRTATDRRFWSIEQQDLYTLIYSKAELADMRWIDWGHIDGIKQFSGVRERCARLGLDHIMCYCCDWDIELIRQFYSTVHISADKTSMTWMADGRRVTTNKRAWEEMFGIPGSVHTEIHSHLFLDDDDKRSLCTTAECTLVHVSDSDLSPLASIANKILKTTIYPRSGKTAHNSHNWNVLYHIVKQHLFDIIALIFGEIDLLMRDLSRTKDLLYAPYIMGMILRTFKYDGPRESRHRSYKPRNYKRKQSKKVGPSAPAAPVVAPPVAAALLEPEVAADGNEAHVEAANNHSQFEPAGHQPVPSLLAPTPAPPLAPSTESSFF